MAAWLDVQDEEIDNSAAAEAVDGDRHAWLDDACGVTPTLKPAVLVICASSCFSLHPERESSD